MRLKLNIGRAGKVKMQTPKVSCCMKVSNHKNNGRAKKRRLYNKLINSKVTSINDKPIVHMYDQVV